MMEGDASVDDAARQLELLDFHHPYTPYDVQNQFMRAVYQVLERGDGQVGVLESPTGTVRLSQRLWFHAIAFYSIIQWHDSTAMNTLTWCQGQIIVFDMRLTYLASKPQVQQA